MSVLLITGTSTGVGKTIVTAALAAIAQTANVSVAVCKPAQTGVTAGQPGDLETIAALSGVTETLELARYPDELAPATAARISNAPLLTLAETAAAITELEKRHPDGLVLVEGAGGLMVRLGEFTLLELAVRLQAPVVVVAEAGLGTLNHTELTTRALQAAGVCCAGIVIGSWPGHPDLAMRCNREDLPTVTGIDVVGIVPAGVGDWDPETFRNLAPTWFAPYVLISR